MDHYSGTKGFDRSFDLVMLASKEYKRIVLAQ